MSKLSKYYRHYQVLSNVTAKGEEYEETEMVMATEILSMIFLLMLAISCGHFLKKSGHKYL